MPLHTLTENQRELISPTGDDTHSNPAIESFHAMALARTLGVAARTGVFSQLAEGPIGVHELASRLALRTEPLQMMLDILVGQDLLDYRDSHYALSVLGKRWLDPDSPTSVATFLSQTLHYWHQWDELENVLAGQPSSPASWTDAGDADAARLVRADYEIARLIADDVAIAIGLPRMARSVLDLGGGHGWFAAALCKRNALVHATVIDDESAVLIGREIMWETDMDRVVSHQVGDIFAANLAGPHDAVLCRPMSFDLGPEKSSLLLSRIRAAMRVGAVLAILRPYRLDAAADVQPASAAALALFLALSSDGDSGSRGSLPEQLLAAGFGPPTVHRLQAVPDVAVYLARAI